MSNINIKLHHIEAVGIRTSEVQGERDAFPVTTIILVDKDNNHTEITLFRCNADFKFIGDKPALDFVQERKQEKADAKLFRNLTSEEEKSFIRWARDNYKPGDPINSLWHPVARQEAECMNREIQNELREEV